jgi:holo-ACP synthase
MPNAPGGGLPVGPSELLRAREARAIRQAAAVARFAKPLVSLTIVMPGAVKDGWVSRRAMEIALQELDAVVSSAKWRLLYLELHWQPTGPEAIYVLDVDANVLKSRTTELEERHPIGRLWDLDVITAGGAGLSRKQLMMPARRCLVCGRPAHECGRSRRHPLRELQKAISDMVNEHDQRSAP